MSASNERSWGAIRFNSSLPMRSSSAVSLRAKSFARRIAAGHGPRRQDAAVYHAAANVNSLEAELVRCDLDRYKAAGLVIAVGEERRVPFQVSTARLAANAGDE